MNNQPAHHANDPDDLREQVRARYAAAAPAVTTLQDGGCCSGVQDECCATPVALADDRFGAGRYSAHDRDVLPADAVTAGLGCGKPTAAADLHDGDTVLDLGSGGGIDVLLSARRIGPTGRVYGLDVRKRRVSRRMPGCIMGFAPAAPQRAWPGRRYVVASTSCCGQGPAACLSPRRPVVTRRRACASRPSVECQRSVIASSPECAVCPVT